MNRWQSFLFLIKQLGDNVYTSRASLLPNDLIIGAVEYGSKPISVPTHAKYLGGVGDGAWYALEDKQNGQLEISRYNTKGQIEYVVLGEPSQPIDLHEEWEIAYDSHLLFTHIMQQGKKIKIDHLEVLPLESYRVKSLAERYA